MRQRIQPSATHEQKPKGRSGSGATTVEVLFVFLHLGCTSFGGPVAHLGYFHSELVARHRWCSEEKVGELIALAQTIPGPASSQVAFALGMMRAGWIGGLAASFGFTLPSALLMLALAYGHASLTGHLGRETIHALQLVAVAVVAQAVLAMGQRLAPDRSRMSLALVATGITLLLPFAASGLIAIVISAMCGLALPGRDEHVADPPDVWPVSKRMGLLMAAPYAGLLILLPVLAHITRNPDLQILSAFYRSGALVFGGGHVVLPLLEDAVVAPGWLRQPDFLAGYGAAQALPGPLFPFAAYLGASIRPTRKSLFFWPASAGRHLSSRTACNGGCPAILERFAH